MNAVAVIDFETYSQVDLGDAGAWTYAENPTTGIYWLCYKLNDLEGSWRPGQPTPADLMNHVASGGTVSAHNASFEFCVWNLCARGVLGLDWPELRVEQLECTMARALALALPGSLDQCAKVLQLPIEKDTGGRRLMLQMCKPKPRPLKLGVVEYYDDEARRERLRQYCAQDVAVQHLLDCRLPLLTPVEREIWEMDFRINLRGVQIDVPSVQAARGVVLAELVEANAELQAITHGTVGTINSHAALQRWLSENGADAPDTTADTVERLLGPKCVGLLPTHVKRVLEIRRDAGKASVAKLPSLLKQSGSDGRARFLFQFGGAARTMRWAGKGPQPQNLPRPDIKQGEIEEVISRLPSRAARQLIALLHGPPISTLSSCLRAMFVAAPGKVLTAADLANIEGRVAAWLSDEQWKLDAFRAFDTILRGQFDAKGKPLRAGPDLYRLAFSRSFGVPLDQVTDEQRSMGKVLELFLQYEGGRGAFGTGAKTYGFEILEEWEEPTPGKSMIRESAVPGTIAGWRKANSNIVAMWKELNALAVSAMLNPGVVVATANGRIQMVRRKAFLLITLPSGRDLYYFNPELEPGRFGGSALTYWGVNSVTRQWEKQQTYGGKIFENIVQAIARDVLADGMVKIHKSGTDIVLHVHDEIVTEHKPGEFDAEKLCRLMCETRPCYEGLPVAAEGWTNERYQK